MHYYMFNNSLDKTTYTSDTSFVLQHGISAAVSLCNVSSNICSNISIGPFYIRVCLTPRTGTNHYYLNGFSRTEIKLIILSHHLKNTHIFTPCYTHGCKSAYPLACSILSKSHQS